MLNSAMQGLASARTVVFPRLAASIMPARAIDPNDWGKANIKLVAGPMAGEAWDPAKTPFWREPLACLAVESPVNLVWIEKSTQVGFTQFALVWVGYLIDVAPATIMAVQPTGSDVKDFNAEQLGPTISASPALRMKVRVQKSRDGEGSTTLRKSFAGGYLVLVGGHAASGLRRRTIKYMWVDEADELPLDLEQQGDPMNMIEARQEAFIKSGDWKRLCGSTPTIDGQSRAADGFKGGDQRYYNVPCPHCRALHKLDFWKIQYSPSWPHNAHYFCDSCGGEICNHHLAWMEKEENGAAWVPENPGARYRSYHIEALYSQLTTWDHIVSQYLTAKDDPTKLKAFTNLVLARAFKVQGNAPDADKLYERREDYQPGQLPPGVLFLTAGVDIQQNRIEYEVVGWGVGKTSWSIDRGVIEGDTMTPLPWLGLAHIYNREFRDWQGNGRKIERMCVDAGYRPQYVYSWVRGRPRALAIKGAQDHMAPPIGTPTPQDITLEGQKRKHAVMLWPVGGWQLKAEFYGFLSVKCEGGFPPGWCHFPSGDLYDVAFYQQLTSEQLVEQVKNGKVKLVWMRNTKFRNEALDCRVYAMAAAYHCGMGQWTPEYWAQLAAERGAPPEQAQLDLLAAMLAPKAPATAGHVSAPAAPAATAQPPATPESEKPANAVRQLRTIKQDRGGGRFH